MPAVNISIFLMFFLLPLLVPVRGHSSGEKPVIRFGINLRYNPVLMYKRYQPFMDYLSENTPYRFELMVSHDYKAALKDLAEGKTQFCSPGDGGLMEALLSYGAVPIVKPLNEEGTPTYRSVMITSFKSPLVSLKDVKGKKVAFGFYHSLSGNLLPRYLLVNNGIRLDELGTVTNLQKHHAVLRAVLGGEYDAGAVKDNIARQYTQCGVRVLAYSNPVPSIPIVAGRNTPKQVIQAVIDALVKLDFRNAAHKKVMAEWDPEFRYGFVVAKLSDYRDISRMYQSIPLGCGAGCHR